MCVSGSRRAREMGLSYSSDDDLLFLAIDAEGQMDRIVAKTL